MPPHPFFIYFFCIEIFPIASCHHLLIAGSTHIKAYSAVVLTFTEEKNKKIV